MQRLGRVCIVELYPGIERAIAFAATSRAEVAVTPAGCKLSPTGLHALLAVVASLTESCQEDAHGETGAAPAEPAAAPTAPAIGPCPRASPPWLPPALAPLPPHRIWTTLAPVDRARARVAIMNIVQEVLDDRHRP